MCDTTSFRFVRHSVTDDGLYERNAFYKVKIGFYSSSVNDGEFINYSNVLSVRILQINRMTFCN